jgi:nitrous oxidase accessory protein NosD
VRRFLLVAAAALHACSDGSAGEADRDAAQGHDDGAVPGEDAAVPATDAAPPRLLVCPTGADYAAIQPAIDAASPGTMVEVCAGTFAENLVIDKPLHLRGAGGAAATVVDGGATGRVLLVQGVGPPGVVIEGLTLRNGRADGEGGAVRCAASVLAMRGAVLAASAADSGGGLSAQGCALEIDDTVFTDHTADASGGGLQLTGSSGHIRASLVTGCSAERGGGIYQQGGAVEIAATQVVGNTATGIGGGIYHDSDAPLLANQVTDNRAGERGGGIAVDQHAPLLDGNTVSGNRSGDDGGGVYLYISRATVTGNLVEGNAAGDDAGGLRVLGSHITLRGNTVVGNSASNDGGGIKISHAESVVEDNRFLDNTAGNYGGGFELDDDHSAIRRCVLSGNRAAAGGGLHANEIGSGVEIEATRITGNRASERGGGVAFSGVVGPAALSFLTIADNTAPSTGGADFAEATARVDDSIIAGNSGTQVRFAPGGGAVGWAWSNIAPLAISGMADPTGSSGNLSADPDFVDPASGDYRLRSASACRNAGDPSLADRDGTRADMGSYGGPEGM